MSQSAFTNTKVPSKPPLPNPLNILSSIPNSAQLASIANAALQNIMAIPSTPPPPPVQLIPTQQNQYICNNNFSSNITNCHKLPPGLPIPIMQQQQQQYIATTSIPNMSSIGNTSVTASPIPSHLSFKSNTNNLNFNNNINNINNININISGTGATTKTTKITKITSSKSRKRGKRGGNKKKESTQDAENEEINETKRNLINAIELERRNHELTKLRLYQLHQHYGEMLINLKKESAYLKNKIIILKNGPTQNDLEVILKQKQSLRNDYLRKRSIRVKDEQQLKQTNKENQKLVIIIHYLKQQLDALLVQYQSLCQMRRNSSNDNEYSDAQRIVNNLDSLDIVDAESMVNQGKNKILNRGNTPGVMSQRIYDDPWFQKIIEENRMLERHIRFLRHIIERETQRCNFKEIIVGKKLISLQKSAEKKVEIK